MMDDSRKHCCHRVILNSGSVKERKRKNMQKVANIGCENEDHDS